MIESRTWTDRFRFVPAGPMTEPQTIRTFVRALALRGDAPALLAVGEGGDGVATWSFSSLADRVSRAALGLVAAGLRPGDTVAILGPNRPEWVALALSALEAGGVVAPIDPQLPAESIERVLALVKCRFAGVSRALAPRVAGRAEVFFLDGDEADPRHFSRLAAEGPRELPPIQASDRAALFTTSGTTGNPKGVPLTHGNIASNVAALAAERLVCEDDRLLLPLPLHHVYPFTVGMLTPLASGSAVVFPSGISGPEIVGALKAARATALVGVPRLYETILAGVRAKARERGLVARAVFGASLASSAFLARRLRLRIGRRLFGPLHARLGPSLRRVASGGARLDPKIAFALEGLGFDVCTGYGLTETSPILTFNARGRKNLATAGRPIEGVEIRIDRRPGEAAGEVQARGPNVFLGYLDDSGRSARAFTEDGWFKTGDLGTIGPDGCLTLVGRVSEMIVRADGKNVQPEDVEAAYAAHPFIAEAAVLEHRGRLAGLLVPDKRAIVEKGGGLDALACVRIAVEAVSRTLPTYERLQAVAVAQEALPRTRLGKLRRHLLPDLFAAAEAGRAKRTSPPEPSAEDRALLAEPVAARVLEFLRSRFPDADVTPDTSPQLDLGVDSLEWVNLTIEIEDKTGASLDEAAVGRVSAVRDLLREAVHASASGRRAERSSPLDDPDAFLGPDARRWLEPLPAPLAALSSALSAIHRAAFRLLFRLRVEGAERLPTKGPFVVAPNHVSDLDPFALAAALPRRARRETYWAGATVRLFTGPFTRALSRLGRVVPVDARGGARAGLAIGAAVLARGRGLVWFPEGQRSFDGRLQPFLPGVGHLAAKFRVPLVPVAIRGTFEALPRGARRPRLVPVTVRFGDPIAPEALAGLPPEEIAGRLRGAVERLLADGS